MRDTLFDPTLIDAVRLSHLVFFAGGLGAGAFAELRILRRFDRPLTERCIQDAQHAHNFVAVALLGLWATGLMLIYIRTGFDPATFSPKLWTKLAVVTVLTLNAVVISTFVVPRYRESKGIALADLPPGRLVLFFMAGSVSLASWFAGAALGSSAVLKVADWATLLPLGVGLYSAAIAGGVVIGLALSRRHGFAVASTNAEASTTR